MAFDITNNADLLALRSEVETDPAGVGYAAVSGNQAALVELVNNKTTTQVTRPVDDIDVSQVAAVIDTGEYDALSAYDKEWVKMLIARPANTSLKAFKNKFLEIFPNGTQTRTDAVALQQVDGSRAEVLFGYGTVITALDWHAARQAV